MIRLLLTFVAFCLPLAAGAASLEPFSASYAIRWGGMNAGNATLRLDRIPGDDMWSYESRLQGRGLFRLALPSNQTARSVFQIRDGHVVPLTYTSSEKDQKVDFDWTSGRVTGSVAGKAFDLPVQDGLLY